MDITTTLKSDLSVALRDVSPYTYENGGWYDIHRGYYDAPSNNKFFFQYGDLVSSYDLNAQISFTSFDSTAVTTSYALNGNIFSFFAKPSKVYDADKERRWLDNSLELLSNQAEVGNQ